MIYPSIRIEGAILSPDILSQVEELPGQGPAEFSLATNSKVKDEIARAWADAQDYWRIFQRKLESLKEGNNATTETRNLWIVPLLGLLRYDLEYQSKGTELNGQIYAISHRATNRDGMSVQIVGYHDPAGLDRKPDNATRRMSAHALVQEFLNLHEQLYGLVTNGHVLRLLRDSSRLVKQSYLEFDLDRIFSDGLFADFAVLYRLLHASRMPVTNETASESLIERYHQDSLDSGARIRAGLSHAVERAILDFGNGFLLHDNNQALRESIAKGELSPSDYYQQLLRLIYRLLFLMVIEERDLVFAPETPKKARDIHRLFYSVARLRRLSEKRYLADRRRHDLWLALQATFQLFEADGPGEKLGIAPLAGDLFSPQAIFSLADCTLGNDVLLGCLRALGLYRHPDSGQIIRVNYGALNVEEFGSVYEGLLEYEPEFLGEGRELHFAFRQGGERAATGSHYTPDELVQPLIQHSLDHLIAERLKAKDPEAALLELRVADIACGSGHILLAAARRIAMELAIVRTGEEQPSPPAYRVALRDAIRNCIYGVDLNPLAVELCKVALWLEAHIPGQPLNFLDHHIKCGNAIVGFARREELAQGVPTEAFKFFPSEDKEVASSFREKNKDDLKHRKQSSLEFTPKMHGHLDSVLRESHSLAALPEQTPAQVEAKKVRYAVFAQGKHLSLLRRISDIPIAQFYIPKVTAKRTQLVTDAEFRSYWRGEQVPQGQGVRAAKELGKKKRFFHWFLEFPEVLETGGFDCILGNPPYLAGTKISTTYGVATFSSLLFLHPPVNGHADLVAYFFRRAFRLLNREGFLALIATERIAQGDTQAGTLRVAIMEGAYIVYGSKSLEWPGKASALVTLVGLYKGPKRTLQPILNGREVETIHANLEAGEEMPEAKKLRANRDVGFAGSYLYGEGFVLDPGVARQLLSSRAGNSEVVRPYLIGNDITTDPNQEPSRYVIDFRGWPIERASKYPECLDILTKKVKPVRDPIVAKGMQVHEVDYWKFWDKRLDRYALLANKSRTLVISRTGKPVAFALVDADQVFADSVVVIPNDSGAAFALFQSSIHYSWILHHCTTRGSRVVYKPSAILNTFPIVAGFDENPLLERVGERYHLHRKTLMRAFGIGLTKVYNLFHDTQLTPEKVAKVSKKDAKTAASGYESLLELRRLHVEMDLAVRDAYGWQDLGLEHDFHEVETLPENDRIRYTISPAARREVLKRLLAENHARADQEQSNQANHKQTKARVSRKKKTDTTPNLF